MLCVPYACRDAGPGRFPGPVVSIWNRSPRRHVEYVVLCAQAMWAVARWYTQFGLMAGTVFREVLADLRAEQMQPEADMVEGVHAPPTKAKAAGTQPHVHTGNPIPQSQLYTSANPPATAPRGSLCMHAWQ